jgi:hypothetical protein
MSNESKEQFKTKLPRLRKRKIVKDNKLDDGSASRTLIGDSSIDQINSLEREIYEDGEKISHIKVIEKQVQGDKILRVSTKRHPVNCKTRGAVKHGR